MFVYKVFLVLTFSLLCFFELSRAEKDYTNHHLYRIAFDTEQHAQFIGEIKEHSIIDRYDPMKNELDLIVSPHKVPHINDFLQRKRIRRLALDYDMQRRIDEEKKYIKPANTSVTDFGWQNYYHLETIYAWLDHLAEKYNDTITILNAGNSYEGVPLKGVKLSYKSGNKVVFIESGIHARERITPATATFILDQLLTSTDPHVRDIAENFDWIVFPTSLDYVYDELKVPYSFTFELRRDHIHVLPADEIIPTGLETLDAFVALLNEARVRSSKRESMKLLLPLLYVFLVAIGLLAALIFSIFIRKKAKVPTNYTALAQIETTVVAV